MANCLVAALVVAPVQSLVLVAVAGSAAAQTRFESLDLSRRALDDWAVIYVLPANAACMVYVQTVLTSAGSANANAAQYFTLHQPIGSNIVVYLG